MSMPEDLRARLLANATIAAKAKKIAWLTRPKNSELPAITMQRVTPGRAYTMKGAQDLQDTGVQFDCWGSTLADAQALAKLVIPEMERPLVVANTSFGMSFLQDESDMPPEDVPGIGLVNRVRVDFTVWWKPN